MDLPFGKNLTFWICNLVEKQRCQCKVDDKKVEETEVKGTEVEETEVKGTEVEGTEVEEEIDNTDSATDDEKEMDHDYFYVYESDPIGDSAENENLKEPSIKNREEREKTDQSKKQQSEGLTYTLQYAPNKIHVACAVEVASSDYIETPTSPENSTEDLEAPALFKVCRICLATNVKMYCITDFQLSRIYQQVTGILVDTDDQLPKVLCWECVGRLTSANRFRDKALAAHSMLEGVSLMTRMTVRDVKSINRYHNNLESTLKTKHLGIDNFDLIICEYEAENPIKCEVNEAENTVKCEENDNFISDSNDDMVFEERMIQVNDKHIEQQDPLVQKYPSFASGGPRKLTKVLKEDVIKKCNIIVNRTKDENLFLEDPHLGIRTISRVLKPIRTYKGRRVVNDTAKQVVINNKSDSENIIGDTLKPQVLRDKSGNVIGYTVKDVFEDIKEETINKNTLLPVLQRQNVITLDESLFTIETPSFEEQYAEIQKRKESGRFKAAKYKCTMCYVGFNNKDVYDNHRVKHSERSGQHECSICKGRFKTWVHWQNHMRRLHTEKYSCKTCTFSTWNRSVAKKHQDYHAGIIYKCPHCSHRFTKTSNYMSHLRIKHPTKFVCELCGYAFVSKWSVVLHKHKKHAHLENTPLQGPYCEECDIRFLSEEAYTRHLKLSSQHSTEDDPDSITNDHQSTANGTLEQRATDGNGHGAVTCDKCGVELASERQYAQHHRRHHELNRPPKTRHMCDQCGKTYKSATCLRHHMWVHTGQKCFTCPQCGKSFSTHASLSAHVRKHPGPHAAARAAPPHTCPLCGKNFSFRRNLTRHIFGHQGLKPHQCEACGKGFTTRTARRAHIEHVHLKVPRPKRTHTRTPRTTRTPRRPAHAHAATDHTPPHPTDGYCYE